MLEETINMHILSTKLNRPKVGCKWIRRPRLIVRFDETLGLLGKPFNERLLLELIES